MIFVFFVAVLKSASIGVHRRFHLVCGSTDLSSFAGVIYRTFDFYVSNAVHKLGAGFYVTVHRKKSPLKSPLRQEGENRPELTKAAIPGPDRNFVFGLDFHA